MKNIIIAGASRTGKSSLAKKINAELNYFSISIDKLVAVFQEAYPQLNIRLAWDRDKMTDNIAPFLGHFLGMFSSADGRGLLPYSHGAVENNRFVLEGGYYNFEIISSILNLYGADKMKDKFALIGLVQNKKTSDDFVADFKKYDTENDWTYGMNDDELQDIAKDAVSFNKSMSYDMKNHSFNIYDTSVDREKVFDSIINDIKNNKI